MKAIEPGWRIRTRAMTGWLSALFGFGAAQAAVLGSGVLELGPWKAWKHLETLGGTTTLRLVTLTKPTLEDFGWNGHLQFRIHIIWENGEKADRQFERNDEIGMLKSEANACKIFASEDVL